MRLTNSDCALELTIVGYQFPAIRDDVSDSNWLQVRLNVQHPRGNWRRMEPCLTTSDLSALISWFEAIQRMSEIESPLEFMEPNLSFAFIHDNDAPAIRVFFELECRPPWAPALDDDVEDDEGTVYIDFAVDDVQISANIAALQAQLVRTPYRS